MATIDKSNDIKIGGTLSTAASSNILVHADEVYDESWDYDTGADQSTINAKLLNYVTDGTGGIVVNDAFHVVTDGNYVFSLVDNNYYKLLSVDTDNRVEINDELLSLSGYSIRTEDIGGRLLKAVIDANGNLLMAIKEDGTCVAYGNVEIGGDSISLSGVSVDTAATGSSDVAFQIIDASGDKLLWVNKDGTVDFKGVPSDVTVAIENASAELNAELTEKMESTSAELTEKITEVNETVTTITGQLYVKETSDGLITMVDAEENRLLTISESGQVEINNELFADAGYSIKVKDTEEDSLFHIVDKDGKVIFNIQSSGKVVIGDGLVIDNAKSGMSITSKGTDAIFAITDANGNVLLWITEDGLVDFKGIPSDVLTEVTTIHDTLESLTGHVYVSDSSDGLVTIVDNDENRLLTISETGQVEINNELLANEGYSIKVKETDADSLFHIVDKDAKVLFNILSDGQVKVGNGIIIDNAKAGMQVLTKETDALLAIVDKDGKILAAVNQYGALMANAITGVAEVSQIDNEDWALVCMDKSGNVLFGVLKDGSFYCHSLSSEYFSEGSSEEFVYVILSKNGKLLFGIRSDGTIYSQGITEGAKEAISELTKTVKDAIEDVTSGTTTTNNIATKKVMYDGNLGKSYLGNVTLQAPGTTDYCIIMMYGQSLSNGSESYGGFWDDPIDRTYMLGTTVQTLSGSTLYPLSVNGGSPTLKSDRDNWCSGTDDAIITTVRSFVNMYKKERPWDTSTKFIACSLGVGGRTVAQLSGTKYKDGSTSLRYPTCNETQLDTRVKTYFESVKAIADAEGATISLSAVFWMQGEADYGTTYLGYTYDEWKEVVDAREESTSCAMGGCYDAYYEGLTILKEDIYALAKDIFGDDQAARPIFMPYSVCGTYISNAYMTIDDATRQMAEDQWDVCQVGPTYQVPDYNGGHLSLNGYRWYGEYCAKALYNVFLKGINHKPMQPYNYEVSGNQVYIYINSCTPPMRFDRYTCGDTYKDYGFTVRAGTVAQLDSNKSTSSNASTLVKTITAISIVENCVVLTCGNEDTLEDYGAVEVIYAGQGQSGYSGHNQGAGNLRDSDQWTALHEYRDDTEDHGSYQTSYWTNTRAATEEDLESLEYWDYDYAKSTGYSTDDEVLYDCIEYDDPRVFTSIVDSNTAYPANPVNYRAKNVKGELITGKTYPMCNWCLNFYKRIVQA